MEKKGICPRCKAEGIEIGLTALQIGATRGIKVRSYNCPKCNLVYLEKAAQD